MLMHILKWAWSHFLWDTVRELCERIWHRFARVPNLEDPVTVTVVIVILSLGWRFCRSRWGNAPRRESRLALARDCTSLIADGLTVAALPVVNRENRQETICHNIVAHITFTSALGQVLRCRGQFVTVGPDRTIEICDRVSLEMFQQSTLCLTFLSGAANYIVSEFPLKPRRTDRLSPGEWHVNVAVTSDADEDCASAEFILQVNPNGATIWTSKTTMAARSSKRQGRPPVPRAKEITQEQSERKD
jgi:hypothetical protein